MRNPNNITVDEILAKLYPLTWDTMRKPTSKAEEKRLEEERARVSRVIFAYRELLEGN